MKSLELMILVGLLVTLGGATQVTQGVLMKRAPCLDGYKFTEGILWGTSAPSAGICSALCVRHHSCVSFTFDGSTCKGYSVTLTSVTPSATPSAGARTFVKGEAVPSYVLAVQSDGNYGYNDPVQFPPNVNVSTMSKLCFSVRVCSNAILLFTHDPWPNSTLLYEVVLGGGTNDWSSIRLVKQAYGIVSKHHSPLNCTEYRKFYVRLEEEAIEVGFRSSEEVWGKPEGCLVDEPFLIYKNPQPFSINSIFLNSWLGITPKWILQGCLD